MKQTKGKETKIPPGSPVSPILFLIYISEIFDKETEVCFLVTFLSSIHNLGFITSNCLMNKMFKIFEKVAKTVLGWGTINAVTYDISKTKAFFSLKSHPNQLNKQLQDPKIKLENQRIIFEKEATR